MDFAVIVFPIVRASFATAVVIPHRLKVFEFQPEVLNDKTPVQLVA